jgi:hypothetical protein
MAKYFMFDMKRNNCGEGARLEGTPVPNPSFSENDASSSREPRTQVIQLCEQSGVNARAIDIDITLPVGSPRDSKLQKQESRKLKHDAEDFWIRLFTLFE